MMNAPPPPQPEAGTVTYLFSDRHRLLARPSVGANTDDFPAAGSPASWPTPTPSSPTSASASGSGDFILHPRFFPPTTTADTAPRATLVDPHITLRGFQLHAIDQWLANRSLPLASILVPTNDDSHVVHLCVIRLAASSQSTQLFLATLASMADAYGLSTYDTPYGTLHVASLATFPTSLSLIHVPSGDMLRASPLVQLHLTLRRLGCGSRGSGGVSATRWPSDAQLERVVRGFQLRLPYTTATPSTRTIIEYVVLLVELLKRALVLLAYLSPQDAVGDGFVCDQTLEAVRGFMAGEMQTPVSATTADAGAGGVDGVVCSMQVVMAVVVKVFVWRTKLSMLVKEVTKDPFTDPTLFTKKIASFQKSKQLPLTRTLDASTCHLIDQALVMSSLGQSRPARMLRTRLDAINTSANMDNFLALTVQSEYTRELWHARRRKGADTNATAAGPGDAGKAGNGAGGASASGGISKHKRGSSFATGVGGLLTGVSSMSPTSPVSAAATAVVPNTRRTSAKRMGSDSLRGRRRLPGAFDGDADGFDEHELLDRDRDTSQVAADGGSTRPQVEYDSDDDDQRDREPGLLQGGREFIASTLLKKASGKRDKARERDRERERERESVFAGLPGMLDERGGAGDDAGGGLIGGRLRRTKKRSKSKSRGKSGRNGAGGGSSSGASLAGMGLVPLIDTSLGPSPHSRSRAPSPSASSAGDDSDTGGGGVVPTMVKRGPRALANSILGRGRPRSAPKAAETDNVSPPLSPTAVDGSRPVSGHKSKFSGSGTGSKTKPMAKAKKAAKSAGATATSLLTTGLLGSRAFPGFTPSPSPSSATPGGAGAGAGGASSPTVASSIRSSTRALTSGPSASSSTHRSSPAPPGSIHLSLLGGAFGVTVTTPGATTPGTGAASLSFWDPTGSTTLLSASALPDPPVVDRIRRDVREQVKHRRAISVPRQVSLAGGAAAPARHAPVDLMYVRRRANSTSVVRARGSLVMRKHWARVREDVGVVVARVAEARRNVEYLNLAVDELEQAAREIAMDLEAVKELYRHRVNEVQAYRDQIIDLKSHSARLTTRSEDLHTQLSRLQYTATSTAEKLRESDEMVSAMKEGIEALEAEVNGGTQAAAAIAGEPEGVGAAIRAGAWKVVVAVPNALHWVGDGTLEFFSRGVMWVDARVSGRVG